MERGRCTATREEIELFTTIPALRERKKRLRYCIYVYDLCMIFSILVIEYKISFKILVKDARLSVRAVSLDLHLSTRRDLKWRQYVQVQYLLKPKTEPQ